MRLLVGHEQRNGTFSYNLQNLSLRGNSDTNLQNKGMAHLK